MLSLDRLTRRRFLKHMAAGTAALSLPLGAGRFGRAQPDRLTAVVNAGPDTMEPTRNNDPNLQVVANIFDGLLRRDAAGDLQPALATSVERVEADVWEIELREGVRFHNGNPFTAEDVKFSLERLSDEFSEFRAFGESIAEVQVEGEHFARVITDGPLPFFANNLHQIFMLDSESSRNRSQQEIAQNPIGTGAYRLAEWNRGQFVDLEANPDYWNGPPAIQNVRHQVVQDDSTRLAALESGDAQLVKSLPVQFADRVRASSELELLVRDGRQAIFFSPQFVDSPFEDIRVRQAAYHALSASTIIDRVLNGFGAPSAQVPDPPTLGYDADIERLEFNRERARQLLSEAGFPNGFDLTVDVTNNQFANDVELGQAVAQLLSQVGINAEARARPASLFFEDVNAHVLDFFIVGWFDGAFDFGRTAQNLLTTDAVFNGNRYSNPRFDALIQQSNQVLDRTEREAVLQEANRVAMEDVALVPLYYEADLWGKTPGLQFQPRSDGWTVYHDLSF